MAISVEFEVLHVIQYKIHASTHTQSQPNVWEYRFLGDIGILSHEHLTANNALSYNYINVKRAS